MLTYSTTSIFDSPHQTLVNPVNTVGVMGAGLALEFKERFPRMFQYYKRSCKLGRFGYGTLLICKLQTPWVLSFPTKQHWREKSQLGLVVAGLANFAESYIGKGITSASFPMLGCGLGGLERRDVVPLMERYLANVAIPITVHVPDGSDK
jgi:O-acetyl-ADP-ribose deacetylase (regulator of RNase III)